MKVMLYLWWLIISLAASVRVESEPPLPLIQTLPEALGPETLAIRELIQNFMTGEDLVAYPTSKTIFSSFEDQRLLFLLRHDVFDSADLKIIAEWIFTSPDANNLKSLLISASPSSFPPSVPWFLAGAYARPTKLTPLDLAVVLKCLDALYLKLRSNSLPLHSSIQALIWADDNLQKPVHPLPETNAFRSFYLAQSHLPSAPVVWTPCQTTVSSIDHLLVNHESFFVRKFYWFLGFFTKSETLHSRRILNLLRKSHLPSIYQTIADWTFQHGKFFKKYIIDYPNSLPVSLVWLLILPKPQSDCTLTVQDSRLFNKILAALEGYIQNATLDRQSAANLLRWLLQSMADSDNQQNKNILDIYFKFMDNSPALMFAALDALNRQSYLNRPLKKIHRKALSRLARSRVLPAYDLPISA